MSTSLEPAASESSRNESTIPPSRHVAGTLVVRTLVLAVLAGVGMLAFIVSPVVEHTAQYTWSVADNGDSAALPLDPYYPAQLTVDVPCATVAAAGAQPVLSTYPLTNTAPAGLQIAGGSGGLSVTSEGVALGRAVPLPPGCATVAIRFTPDSTAVSSGGAAVATFPGDHRPRVAGFFTGAGARSGLRATTVADTQFDTSSSGLKWFIGALSVLALLGALVGVGQIDRALGHRMRSTVRQVGHRWRPRALRGADAFVVLGLPLWALIGPPTPDDGYITEIIRGRSTAGLISNYAHWYNSPEAPFGWFYEIYAAWAGVSHNTVWMRVPSVLIGIATWFLLSRGLAPRLIHGLYRARHTLPARVALPVIFLLWWFPFGQGLRPETWLMGGIGLVVYLVDRACTERRLLLLCLAALVAGLTVGIGPTGLTALTPFVAGLPRIIRWLRQQRALVVVTVLLTTLAALGAVVLLMFADQSLAAVLSGTHLRTAVGPNDPWYEEYLRYHRLLDSHAIEGTVYRLAPIVLSAAAGTTMLAVLLRDRGIPGVRRPMLKLVVVSYLLSFAALAATPTKLTHHFAAAGLLGALVVTCVAYAAGPAVGRDTGALRTPLRRGLVYIGGGLALALVFTGYNNSWLYSSLGLKFLEAPPAVGVKLSTLFAVGGLLAGGTAIAAGVASRFAERGGAAAGAEQLNDNIRRTVGVPVPARRVSAVVALVLSFCLLFEFASFAAVLATRHGKYTLGGANLATLAGDPCGLTQDLLVEDNLAAGILGAGSPALSAFDATTPGTALPTWRPAAGQAAQLASGWIALPESARSGRLPLVLATHGVTADNTVAVEFRTPEATSTIPVDPKFTQQLAGADLADFRMDITRLAPGATDFRVVADVRDPASAAGPLAVAAPRVPVGRSLRDFTAGKLVATDWLNTFFLPCLSAPNTVEGRAQIAQYQITVSDENNDGGNYNPLVTGAFAEVASIIARREIPIYLPGDPTYFLAHLYRFAPQYTTVLDRPVLRDVTRSGSAATPPLLLPPGVVRQ